MNLYLLGESVGIKEDIQHNVILTVKSYPLNKTSKNIPGFFLSTTGADMVVCQGHGKEALG